MTTGYRSQSARDAQRTNYGNRRYWEYLEQSAQELHDYFISKGMPEQANAMFTQSLSERLAGNEGE